MLSQPDQKTLEALAALEHDERFKVVLAWLVENKNSSCSAMSTADGNPVYRAQGAFGVLDNLHTHATKAREQLAQLSRSQ